MRNIRNPLALINFSAAVMILTGCIHEYPYATQLPATPPGNTPASVSAYIEVEYDLDWETMLHHIDFSTKAEERNHRFIIEVRDGEETVCRDIHYIGETEFTGGRLRRRLSSSLSAKRYEMAVWYDMEDEDRNYPYSIDCLDNVRINNYSSTQADAMRCGYAWDILDLTGYSDSEESSGYTKELQLQHPAARFEIVATDINQFISDNREALLQGDSFSVTLTLENGANDFFDIYGNRSWKEENVVLSGRMRLPFDEYDQLKIAEGVAFCKEEDEMTATLTIRNSALSTVSQTERFSFPVKRGYITTVTGDFLTNSLDGIFTVDNVWDGVTEYVVE